jgi:hypothetical protein
MRFLHFVRRDDHITDIASSVRMITPNRCGAAVAHQQMVARRPPRRLIVQNAKKTFLELKN